MISLNYWCAKLDAIIDDMTSNGDLDNNKPLSQAVSVDEKRSKDVSAAASALVIAAGDKAGTSTIVCSLHHTLLRLQCEGSRDPNALSLYLLLGMDGIDRARIDEIILRESGDSAYMKQQRKRDQSVNERIKRMKDRLYRSGGMWKNDASGLLDRDMDKILLESRCSRSTCVVVDMDMFYMACELLTRPDLRHKPACVGSGMILTSNYCARRYGVRSAMAGWIGDKLVSELSAGQEQLHHVPANYNLYSAKARVVREVLSQYDPTMRAYSLDEAYLNIGPYVELHLQGLAHQEIARQLKTRNQEDTTTSTAAAADDDNVGVASLEDKTRAANEDDDDDDDEDGVANDRYKDTLAHVPQEVALATATRVVAEMRARVREATGGLTCSAGLASNFMLAKIASDRNKPNGQMVVAPSHEDVVRFLHPLPTRKIPGIGRVTDKILQAFDIKTVRNLYDARAMVRFLFKPATASFLLRASLGCSGRSESSDNGEADRKGISRERTFRSGEPWAQVNARLEDIARKLANDMQEKNLWAHTITVKVKLHTFNVLSRARSLPNGRYVQDGQDLVAIATELLHQVREKFRGPVFSVRLLGVRCSNFQPDDERQTTHRMNIKKFFHDSKPKGVVRAASPPVAAETQNVRHTSTHHSEAVSVVCPVCGQRLPRSDNAFVNQHIDECLNAGSDGATATVKAPAAKRRRKHLLTDFFAQ